MPSSDLTSYPQASRRQPAPAGSTPLAPKPSPTTATASATNSAFTAPALNAATGTGTGTGTGSGSGSGSGTGTGASADTDTGAVRDGPCVPWSSPSLRSSPTDQLIAAILDGDVRGIRTVVKGRGVDLKSGFWLDLASSILPLHRAISGLHFHGSDKLLVGAIDELTILGADPNEVDKVGNTALHKAVTVCTSKSVMPVVQALLDRGAGRSCQVSARARVRGYDKG